VPSSRLCIRVLANGVKCGDGHGEADAEINKAGGYGQEGSRQPDGLRVHEHLEEQQQEPFDLENSETGGSAEAEPRLPVESFLLH
jgi:hypothetical protein